MYEIVGRAVGSKFEQITRRQLDIRLYYEQSCSLSGKACVVNVRFLGADSLNVWTVYRPML